MTSSLNPATTPFEGTRFVFWNSFGIPAGEETRIVSVAYTTTGTTNVDVNFRWFNENEPAVSSGVYLNEGVQVQYSLNGTTWTDAGAFIPRHDGTLPSGTGAWKLKTVALPAGAGNQPTLYVGFKFHSEFGDNCAPDAVNVTASTPSNDEASGALTLSVGAGCTGATYSDIGATSSVNEPYPSCSDIKVMPVWFKFVAPASGAVRISTDLGAGNTLTDSKIGLFSGTDASAYSDFQIIACDEDGGNVLGSGSMSVLYATGLTPALTYYIAVDKFSNSTGSGTFCLAVDELNASMLSTTNTCASTYQSPVSSGPVTGYAGWTPLLDANSKLVALVKNPAGGNPALFGIGQNINTGPVRSSGSLYYLDRNIRIANATATNVQVQFFFLTSELNALIAADPAVTLSNLSLNRQTEAIPGCYNNFVAGNGTTTLVPQTQNGTSADGLVKWIQVTTPGFSNFFARGGNTVLPIQLLSFSGYRDGSSNQLRWVTSSEQNNMGFEMQRSTDGINYSSIGFVNSLALGGNSTTQLNYTFTDNNVSGNKQYYRLRQVNFDGNSKLSNIVLIKGEKPVSLTIEGLFPNPAKSIVNVLIAAPTKNQVTVVISDLAGKTVIQQLLIVETGSNTIPVDIGLLAKGTYLVKLVCGSGCDGRVGTFVKQ